MNEKYKHTNIAPTQALLRPHSEHEIHELKVVLESPDGTSSWMTTLKIDTQASAIRKFFIFDLASGVRPPGAVMHQVDGETSELVIPLTGVASPAAIHDLSQRPLNEWMATMFKIFASSPAAVAVLVNRGRISVVLNGADVA